MLRYATPLIFGALGGIVSERSRRREHRPRGHDADGRLLRRSTAPTSTGSWVVGLLVGDGRGRGRSPSSTRVFSVTPARRPDRLRHRDQLPGARHHGLPLRRPLRRAGHARRHLARPRRHAAAHQGIPFVGDAIGKANLLTWLALICVVVADGVPVPHAARACACARSASTRARPRRSASRSSARATSPSIASGVLAALGGAYLSIGFVGSFNQNMTAGRGFIALAAVIFGKLAAGRRARGRAAVRLLQRAAQRLPAFSASGAVLFQALPYVLTLIAVAGVIGRSRPPAAVGQPYVQGVAWPSHAWPSSASGPAPRPAAPPRTSPTRSSSTSARTRRCCAPAARRACACSSPRTARWARACTRWPSRDELDLGAFLYAIRRLPEAIVRARRSSWARRRRVFAARGHRAARGVGRRRGAGAPAALVRRRRRGAGRPARLGVRRRRPRADARRLPDRVEQDPPAHAAPPAGRRRDGPTPEACAAALGGAADDWARLRRRVGRRASRTHLQRDRRRAASRCACACSAARRSATRA